MSRVRIVARGTANVNMVDVSHLAALVLSLVPVEEVTAHPPPGSPFAQGRRRFVVEREENLSLYINWTLRAISGGLKKNLSNIFSYS